MDSTYVMKFEVIAEPGHESTVQLPAIAPSEAALKRSVWVMIQLPRIPSQFQPQTHNRSRSATLFQPTDYSPENFEYLWLVVSCQSNLCLRQYLSV